MAEAGGAIGELIRWIQSLDRSFAFLLALPFVVGFGTSEAAPRKSRFKMPQNRSRIVVSLTCSVQLRVQPASRSSHQKWTGGDTEQQDRN